MKSARNALLLFLAVAISLSLAACGSGSSATQTPPATFTIGGTVSGLAGSGLVLQDNGGDNLALSANGSFTFKTAITSGGSYKVTVLTQPSTPAQTCAVTGGTGTASANVTSVQVACTTIPTFTIGGLVINLVGTGGGLVLQDNGGDNLIVNANGTFTFATPLVSGTTYAVTVFTQPSTPAQTCAVTSGTGTATANVTTVQVDCGHNEWTWTSGSNIGNQLGTYGTQGTAAVGNIPGARFAGVSWSDKAGDFWMFGGGGGGFFNDLWRYSGGQWTWMGGSNLQGQMGTYGTLGTPAASNIPGARTAAVVWTDKTGNTWLFGGVGYDSAGILGRLNDLWMYSAGQWAWMGGSNVVNQKGIYGVLGTAASSNVPGARQGAVSWTDSAGSLWLFAGLGYDSTGTSGRLNDLWMYSAGQWTWVGGSNLANQKGIYGALGTAAVGNVPGGRIFPAHWSDKAGNLWLFGGLGYDSNGTVGSLNDLWKYSAGQWTWMGGSNVTNQTGTYGTQRIPAASNVPGAREFTISWTDQAGSFWLFGGHGYDSTGTLGDLNDLWKYSAGEWTWVGGANVVAQKGVYGNLGVSSPSNIPGSRQLPVVWIDANGNLWLFGGMGEDSTATLGYLNDLWMYKP